MQHKIYDVKVNIITINCSIYIWCILVADLHDDDRAASYLVFYVGIDFVTFYPEHRVPLCTEQLIKFDAQLSGYYAMLALCMRRCHVNKLWASLNKFSVQRNPVRSTHQRLLFIIHGYM